MDVSRIALALSCWACAAHGWRVQRSFAQSKGFWKLAEGSVSPHAPREVNRSDGYDGSDGFARQQLKSLSMLLTEPSVAAAFRSSGPRMSAALRPLAVATGTRSRYYRYARGATRQEVLVAAACSFFSVGRALAADRSLTDSEGRFVVDPRKAAAGLEDPVNEPDGAYGTISAALAVAPSGSTIIVRPGTYTERLMITRPIRLLADSNAVVMWKTDKPYEAVLTVALDGDSIGAGTNAEVFVSGLTIRHSSKSIAQNYGVYIPEPSSAAADKARIELRSCDITSFTGTGVGVEGGDVTLSKCQVSECKNHGVAYVGPKARGTVVGCTVEKCKLNGLLMRDGASPTFEANTLRKNGQYGASLIDCRGKFLGSNDASSNGKGAVNGNCDTDSFYSGDT